MARWGMPGPSQFGDGPITNIRNVGSPHWRGWLGKPKPLHCTSDFLLRVRRHKAAQDAEVVRVK